MHTVRTVERLEAIVGAPRAVVLMKAIEELDDGCRGVLAASPIAWFGFRDHDGTPRTTLIGGFSGFLRVDSPTRVSLNAESSPYGPVSGGGASFVFLLPGIGETLRVNGWVVQRSGTRVVVDVQEAFVHCARCILRSGLWTDASANRSTSVIGLGAAATGPLADAAVAEFLASSPFAAVSSWDGEGFGDTSPKGDHPGFIRILDNQTLAIPDRRGNQRADTLHNILACDRVSLAALVPGRVEILHLDGTAHVTDEPELLRTMAVGDRPPKAALIVRIRHARIEPNEAVHRSNLWSRSSHVDPSAAPDLMRLAARHLAQNRTRGATASLARTFSRGLAASPAKLLRLGVDRAYRKQLTDEGY